ncbi:MAG: energy-coupling factor transporter transmembrane component T family protein [[Clostridium] leptum]
MAVFPGFGAFYLVLALLLYLIRFHGLHMVVFSEFYVLMFYNLMPVFLAAWDLITTPPGQLSAALSKAHTPTPAILGLLVVFRFFPTMKAELKGVRQSMKNRRLTGPVQVLRHPAVTCEYVLVPLLLRCLQIADQLSISAIARGAQAPGLRGSYYARRMQPADFLWLGIWTVGAILFFIIGGIK